MKNHGNGTPTPPTEIPPAQIRKLRSMNKLSQSVFASRLNISESALQPWETGRNRPSKMALKLLTIVKKHGLRILD